MKKIVYTLLASGFLSSAFAQDDMMKYAQTISKDDLKKHLSILASDEYEGRETGKKGQKMAADYIQKQFEALGLAAPVKNNSNPFFQPIELEEKSWGEVSLKTAKTEAKFLEDFFVYGNFEMPATDLEFVFAGYGLDSEKYSDYSKIDVKGKGVVIMIGEPTKKDGTFLLTGTTTASAESKTGNKLKLATEKGAKAILFVYPNQDEFTQTLNYFKNFAARPSLGLPSTNVSNFGLFYVAPKTAAALLGTDEKKFMKNVETINKSGKNNSGGKLKAKLSLKAERKINKVSSENVLGFMEGTDKKDEILAITAHYDHIGISADGKINNGADDDGSGTVSVLEIAEAFQKAKAEGKAPRRSILFMLFTGEEKGLLGSEHYSNNPVFPMAQTITNLNIDMVGRVDEKHAANPNYIYVIGSDMLSTDLHKVSEETAKNYFSNVELDYTYNNKTDPNRFYYRSDHYNFAKHKVPVIFYFNGTHEDYHQPTDEVEKIHFDKMEKIARLIFGTAWQLANKDARPVVDKSDSE